MGGEVSEQNQADDALQDSTSEEQEFLRDAVEMDDVPEPGLGDVQAEPGAEIAVVDGVAIRNVIDERDRVLPVEDDSGQVIGRDSFPEDALDEVELPPDRSDEVV
jgi:hypothetical protein